MKAKSTAIVPHRVGLLGLWLSMGLAVLLQGCASTTPAPVSERTVPPQASAKRMTVPPVAAAKPAPVPIPAQPADTGALPPAVVSTPDAAVEVKPLAPAGEEGLYTVKPGDTLFSIARANGVAVRDLAAWNNIEDPGSIRVGQQLRLTSPGDVTTAPVVPATPPAPAAVEVKPAEPPPVATDSNTRTQPLGVRVPYSEQAYAQMSKQPAAPVEAKPDEKTAKPEVPRADGEVDWAWPVQGKVVANFNDATMKGIAIAGMRGQPVRASAGGKVIFAGTGIRGLGQLVVIRHNNTYSSVYAHNDRILVKEGQNVTRGQTIAEMGNSDTDSVKLHFEIRRQGRPLDPMKLLPGT